VDDVSKEAVVIDSVLDYDPASGKLSSETADALLAKIKAWGLAVKYILDTHVHADHLTAGAYLKSHIPGSTYCMGTGIPIVQKTFAPKYNLSMPTDGSQFDKLLSDGDSLPLSERFTVDVVYSPGHTPDHLTFAIGGSLYCGDTLFLPDVGSARCDFPNGSAETLWKSVQRLFSFPQDYDLYVGHDYPPEGREVGFSTTIAEQMKSNKHVKDGTVYTDFVKWRSERDATLGAPRLLHPFSSWLAVVLSQRAKGKTGRLRISRRR
jgi:glyoxylase-like metal-dependent hydrolase (beta-lactamase superfamily II)